MLEADWIFGGSIAKYLLHSDTLLSPAALGCDQRQVTRMKGACWPFHSSILDGRFGHSILFRYQDLRGCCGSFVGTLLGFLLSSSGYDAKINYN